MSDNPYEPPRVGSVNPFREPAADVRELERRIALLEKKISRSWLLSSNIFYRFVAIIGHFLLGYAVLTVFVVSFVWLANWLGFVPIFY